ncbi:histidine phosphatase family protein [Massilia sp. DJPM01]|uniref:histidine phosphatase family protein n=1 Tax=Massilia sp. DJPM01 TaxID=3024404 RepID=UPI00259D4990|nr:histidine phosphatase family protein [Massilia sp. DJPM01]MDM5176111.1 histidine phosphatase family protein [Massilia sp. DJPM01]
MGAIYLVRHGQASFGKTDYDNLSELGRRQSALLGQRLVHLDQKISLFVSGTHRRHLQSLEACLEAWSVAGIEYERHIRQDARFDEFDHADVLLRFMPQFPDLAALSAYVGQQDRPEIVFQEMFEHAVARWVGGAHDAEYRESWNAFQIRCNAALTPLLEHVEQGNSAIVFTSGGPISAICQQLLAIPDQRIFDLNWSLVNAGVTKLVYGKGRICLSYLNNFSHLEAMHDESLLSYR